MHIAITASFLDQPNTGSGQYLRGLLGALTQGAPQHQISLLAPAHVRRSAAAGATVVPVATPFDGRSEDLAKLWFEQIGAPLAARQIRADLLHVPYFAPPLAASMPVVTSILDIIPLLLPAYRGRAPVRAYMRLVATAARRAAHVLTISAASRRDIIAHLQIPPERITVTPLAAGPQYHAADRAAARREVAARYGVESPFLYYVGGLDARKNVATLIRAFARMRRAGGPDVPLVIAGRALGGDPQLFPDIDSLIAEEQIAPWVRRIEVPAADSALLYSAAELFAYPSRYEGFGLGPLEAMACGTPTIVSDASSLPEVVGDAARCVAPDDIDAWAAALRELLERPDLRERLRASGLARAAQFSYAETARRTIEVYHQIGGMVGACAS
jgi:glycosyltransferase involved in cell wall biosynthesis